MFRTEFQRSLAMTSVCMVTALGSLGLGEHASDKHKDNVRECYELPPQQVAACKKDAGPGVAGIYTLLILGSLGAGGFMGYKTYQAHLAEVERDNQYRKAEGLI